MVLKHRLDKLSRSGMYRRVSSEAAWVRLEEMLAADWSVHAIATATGICPSHMQGVLSEFRLRGYRQTFGPKHAAAIVNAGKPTAGTIGALGTRRRIRALAAIGHPLSSVAKAAGISVMSVSYIRSGTTRTVTPAMAEKVADAYERLSMTVGTSEQTRALAKAQGWHPPLAYDEDGAIDDPKHRPQRDPRAESFRFLDEVAITEAMSGRRVELTRAERREAVRRLVEDHGLSQSQAAQRVGLSEKSAYRVMRRAKELAA